MSPTSATDCNLGTRLSGTGSFLSQGLGFRFFLLYLHIISCTRKSYIQTLTHRVHVLPVVGDSDCHCVHTCLACLKKEDDAELD